MDEFRRMLTPEPSEDLGEILNKLDEIKEEVSKLRKRMDYLEAKLP